MIELVIEQRCRDLGGFEVGRLLPYSKRRMVGPFIFLDRMGPVVFPPGIPKSVDVRPHPHIWLSTVTYLLEGEIMHRDSVGSEQPIRPGEVNWMTAGRGITHSERFERGRREGGPLNGVQAWVALPVQDEETDPEFAHYGSESLPSGDEAGVWVRVLAGEAFGMKADVRTHSPLFYVHCVIGAGARLALPDAYAERALYVASGAIEVEHRTLEQGSMPVFRAGAAVTITAQVPAVCMLLGGEPLGERFIEWNFVSSSKARIEQAKADWRAGRMKLPENDDAEFIPLPGDPAAPANPMS
jgi:redox-sensitive bicupin YhaK (pirin superfamily)